MSPPRKKASAATSATSPTATVGAALRGRPSAATPLPKRLQPILRLLEKDLLERAKIPSVEAGLKTSWEVEKKAGETGQGFDPWRRARVTQLAAAWVLSVVFVRTLEDRGLIAPRLGGPGKAGLKEAKDREAAFAQLMPFLGPREYLLATFRELAQLPGAAEVFDTRHNPVWVLAPSSEGARALLDFFQAVDAQSGEPALSFSGSDTRFLGDLYQDLSEAVRKRYALLQTPDFVERFILEQTLTPAIQAFGLKEVRLIDPTCGSGHFLLGAFRMLLEAWHDAEPNTPIETLASRALGQVYGVDINPYAVAIARFRLVLAVLDAVGIKRLDKAPVLRPNVVVADSLLHRLAPHHQATLLTQQIQLPQFAGWGQDLFRLTEPGRVHDILSQRYHAVVGNPPYITEKDATKRNKYRELYESASGKYALAAPFTERFFDLGAAGGFVGMINSNAWTKRDYGKTLIEKVLPKLDVQKVIDTSGCYLPGHGTPTLLLFGRHRETEDRAVTSTLVKRGERGVPADPARAPVWSEIIKCHDSVGYDGEYVSVEAISRAEIRTHPWILVGGGARSLFAHLASKADLLLSEMTNGIGFAAFSGQDQVFLLPDGVPERRRIEREFVRRLGKGEDIRDWDTSTDLLCLAPYDRKSGQVSASLPNGVQEQFWPLRRMLLSTLGFAGLTRGDTGGSWWQWSRWVPTRHGRSDAIVCCYVGTHNHFCRADVDTVYRGGASVNYIDLKTSGRATEGLLGYLNSSTVGFWCRLVMYPKGGATMGDGAIVTPYPWMDRLEYAGNLLQQLPVPSLDSLREALLDLVVAAEDTVQQMNSHRADAVVPPTLAATPTAAALRAARAQSLAERARLRGILVSLQEEMDWRVYGLFGLPTLTAPSVEAVKVPVAPNHRPFEVRLAREVETDISASEWFRVHKRTPPADVDGPLVDLYRQRLRLVDHPQNGKQLRLLETPETKRRWSPPDDEKAFDAAVRDWLLDRLEQVFRDQQSPELRSSRVLAQELGRDPAVHAAHELLSESSGQSLDALVADLLDSQGVPFLAGYRYTETGMEKRQSWEETWRLQRLEDQGQLAPELKRLKLESIPVPDKYANKDFQRHYWGLRGKLDVPKERFITVPQAHTDDDPTLVCGWAGWDHLQAARALATLYQQRKDHEGWSGGKLVPLLAGLAERVPWLLQWHDEPDPDFGGERLGQFFRDFVLGEAHGLGLAVDFAQAMDPLRSWAPPATARKQSLTDEEVLAAFAEWKPEQDNDDDEEADDETEPPAGPTAAELADVLGAKKALVTKALKKLETTGLVEKLEGRPARYVVVGEAS